ncbi:MAG: ABC transporter ATP-binding protein/permease [Clostridiales bacterium]|nr:ABC transporter ATP-binding protein/permease [Clostridiales bacterium]
MKEKPKYSVGSNVAYMTGLAWKRHRSVLWICAAIALFTVAKTVTEMLIAPLILGVIESRGSLGTLLSTVGLFTLLLIVTGGGLRYFQENALFGRVGVRSDIVAALERKRATTAFSNLLETRFLEFSKQASTATSGNNQATEAIWTTLTTLAASLLGFALYLALLSNLNFWLAAITTCITVAGFFFNLRMSRWSYDHREELAKPLNGIGYASDLLCERKYAKDLRIFGMADWAKDLWEKNLRLFRSLVRQDQRHMLWGNLMDVALGLLRNGLAYFVLINMVLRREITPAEFLLYFSAVSGFTAWVAGILEQCATLRRQSLDISKVREFLDWEEPFRFDSGAPIPDAPYTFCLEDVSYRYPETETDTISHMNLTLRPGEKLAIVGLNGAGKTTLIKLLAGFLDPTQGKVTLNGVDIREFDRREYYKLFAAVFQDFSVLPATVRENITQTLDAPEEEKLWHCLEQAGLKEKIQSLPKGIETQVTRRVYEDGMEFSGGETQRLMLARVLYRGSPVLLLDEPTAALDPIAENDIYQKYNEMTAGKTALFISHRLASTRFCDRILFLEKGTIAEEGTHDSLMEKNGKYAALFAVQKKYYEEGADSHEE